MHASKYIQNDDIQRWVKTKKSENYSSYGQAKAVKVQNQANNNINKLLLLKTN
jgi:hypothetical protein